MRCLKLQQMKRERGDVVGAMFVKDGGNIMVEKEMILERWSKYFNELLYEENEYTINETEKVEGPQEKITEEEVKEALKEMKNGRAAGPSGLTVDLIKAEGKEGVVELTRVLNNVLKKGEIPEDWKGSYTIPIFNGKGDALKCGNYRGIRLLEHGMKVYEKVLEKRLRRIIRIDKCQFGFCPGRSTTEAIYTMRGLQEGFMEKRRRLYHVILDLEKALDRVPREIIRWALRRQSTRKIG